MISLPVLISTIAAGVLLLAMMWDTWWLAPYGKGSKPAQAVMIIATVVIVLAFVYDMFV